MECHTRQRFHRMFLGLLAGIAGCLLTLGHASAAVSVATTLTGEDTLQHLQETNTVCGPVASAKYVASSPEKPTYLNLDHPYPNQTCAVVIPGSARSKFKNPPETIFMGKIICVTGFITANRGKPQITVTDPSQITIQGPATPATNSTPPAVQSKTP